MKSWTNNNQKAPARMLHARLNEDLHRRFRVTVAARDETILVYRAARVAREVEPQGISLSQVNDV